MIRALFKSPIKLLFSKEESNLIHIQFLHNLILKNPKQEQPNDSPFTILDLINSCGLSPQSALSISRRIHLKNPENPDSLIKLFKSYDFTNTQIVKLIRKCPVLLSSNLDRTLTPKLDYLQSVGYSGVDLTTLVSSVPHILTASLENKLKPNFELLVSIIGDNRQVASAVRQTSRLLQSNIEVSLLANVRVLKTHGIPERNIGKLVASHPRVMIMSNERFSVAVELIGEMGFNPLSMMFAHGVAAVSRFSPSTWDHKMAFIKSLGWSEREVISAFAKQPFFMLVSDHKLRKVTEFYAKKMKWGPSFLAARPVLICMSLEKRVIPRCSTLSVLEGKGLVEEWNSAAHFLMISERDFLSKYVLKYSKKVPEVLKAYEGCLEFPGFGSRVPKCQNKEKKKKPESACIEQRSVSTLYFSSQLSLRTRA